MSTLRITHWARASHDREILRRLEAYGTPATVAELFDGCEPRWAMEATDRLIAADVLLRADSGRVWPVAKLGKAVA